MHFFIDIIKEDFKKMKNNDYSFIADIFEILGIVFSIIFGIWLIFNNFWVLRLIGIFILCCFSFIIGMTVIALGD